MIFNGTKILTGLAIGLMALAMGNVNAQTCTKTGSVCVQGAATKMIEGAPVYRECWEYKDTYSCYESVATDTCAPLRTTTGCFELTASCADTNLQQTCVRFSTTMRCDHNAPTPAGATALPPVFTVVSDKLVPSEQCAAKMEDANCTRTNRVCKEGPETRLINGLAVTKSCWAYEDTYSCTNSTDGVNSNCAEYVNDPKCKLKSSSCLMQLPGGQCGSTEKIFTCEVTPEKKETKEVCETMSCDAQGVCIKATDSPDQDFGATASGMEIARQIGTYLDPNSVTAFNGEASFCSKGNLGVSSCCGSKGGGESNSSVIGAMLPNLGEGAKEVIDVGSKYVYDSLASNETMNQGMSAMASQINNWFSGSADSNYFNGSFDPTFSYMGFSATIGGAQAGAVANLALGNTSIAINFNPYMLMAQIAIQWLTQCSNQDSMTGLRKGQRLCHHVGSYCGEKFLGSCIKAYEGHCCYNSRLARIIQEQGRPQIGKGWGIPESPQCGGFTESELKLLDFSKMDLSEFIAEIQQKAINTVPGTNRATTNVANKVQNYFQNNSAQTEGGLYTPGNASGNLHRTQTGNAPSRTGVPQ